MPVALLLLILLYGGRAEAAAGSENDEASTDPGRRRLYLWVIRHTLEDTVALAALADSAASVGCTDLLVQVRGRGEAYYRSNTEPAPRSLETPLPEGVEIGDRPSEESLRFDPLATAIRVARARGLRVHAWFNVFLAGEWNERRRSHILVRRPELRIRLKDRSLPEDLSASERGRLNFEGIYLSPGNPEVLIYLRGLLRELTWRYRLDGVHFDYVRYPYTDAGYDEGSLRPFKTAEAEGTVSSDSGANNGDRWDAWRARQVSRTVEVLAKTARATAPAIEVSAAVIPDPADALKSCMQDWPLWIERGWCDRVFLMAYTKSLDRIDFWQSLAASRDPTRSRIVLGLGLHKLNPSELGKSLDHIREKRIGVLALFSDVEFREDPGFHGVVRKQWGEPSNR